MQCIKYKQVNKIRIPFKQGIIYISRWMIHEIWKTLLHVISILGYWWFFLKVNDAYWKYYISISLQQFTKIFTYFFTCLGQTKIWKLTHPFYLSNWINESSFEIFFLDNVLINENYFKSTKKTTEYEHIIFIWLSLALKQLLEKLYIELSHALNFSCAWNKEASSCR